MKIKIINPVFILALLLSINATFAHSADFVAYEGKGAVIEGQGGGKKVVDGIDFWSDGDPPYKYKLLGYLTDRRLKSGLFGMISMSGLESNIASEAKKAGGDGVIVIYSDAETVGGVSNGVASGQSNGRRYSGSGTGISAAIQKNNSKFAVVKYLKDEAVEPSAEKPILDSPVQAPLESQ